MVEKLSNSPESIKNLEALEDSHEKEKLGEQLEKKAEQAGSEKGKELDSARREALEEAVSEKDRAPAEKIEAKQPDQGPITKKQLDQNFKKTMDSIRKKDMGPASRTFSKIIHHPVIDKTSEALGKTVARPNLILAGALGTLILGSIVYFIAKRYGYVLSGFEAIGTFILGWAVGAIAEFARVGFSNKKR